MKEINLNKDLKEYGQFLEATQAEFQEIYTEFVKTGVCSNQKSFDMITGFVLEQQKENILYLLEYERKHSGYAMSREIASMRRILKNALRRICRESFESNEEFQMLKGDLE